MQLFRSSTAVQHNNANDDQEKYFATDEVKADLKGRTVRGGAVTVATQFIKQFLSIVELVILGRLLSPADNGLVGMVLVITGFIALFNDLGLASATIQRSEINQRQVSAMFWINVAIGVVLAILLAIFSPAIAWFYNDQRLIPITLVVASTFIFGGLTVQHRALMKRQMRFTALSVIEVISTVVDITVTIACALAGLGYWSLVIGQVAGYPVQIIGVWLASPWRPGRPATFSEVRSMVTFGSNLTGFRLLNYLARNLDNVLIGRFFGAEALGLYAKAYGLLLLPLRRVNEPTSAVATPALSRLADSPARYRQAYLRIATKVCLVTMPLLALMIATSDWLILVVLGPKWTEASTMFALLAISGLIEPISNTTGWLFVSQGRGRDQLQWGVLGTILTVVAIVAGLPWGPNGVAASYGITGLFIRTPLLFWLAGRTGPVTTADLYRAVAPYAVASVVLIAAVMTFRLYVAVPSAVVGLIAATLIGGVAALLTVLIIPASRAALNDLKNIPAILMKRKPVV